MFNPYDVVVGNGKYGNTDTPLTEMSMGNVYDFGKNVLIPSTRGAKELGLAENLGSSASGAYQIIGSTMAAHANKLFGENWRSLKYTPDVQDKLAESIFNDADKTSLHKVWTSLPEKDYSGVKWEDIKGVIQKGESGGSGKPVSSIVTPTTVPSQNTSSFEPSLEGLYGSVYHEHFNKNPVLNNKPTFDRRSLGPGPIDNKRYELNAILKDIEEPIEISIPSHKVSSFVSSKHTGIKGFST